MLNFGCESCEIRILSCSIQKIHTLRKEKTRFYFFHQAENKFQNFQGNLMVYDASRKICSEAFTIVQNYNKLGVSMKTLL